MPNICQACERTLSEREVTCANCGTPRDKSQDELNQSLNSIDQSINNIMLTTECNPNLDIEERVEVITAECAFGMNIIRDIFTNVTDIVGGRSTTIQNTLKEARKTVLLELKKEAHDIGADAVVAVDLDYSEFSGKGKSMLFIVASGTAVKLVKTDQLQAQ